MIKSRGKSITTGATFVARLVAGEWRFNKAALLLWFSDLEPPGKSSKERMLAAFGAWKAFGEDPEQMIEEMARARKAATAKKE